MDPSGLTKEDLESILMSMGLEDIGHMSTEEMRQLFTALNGETNNNDDSFSGDKNIEMIQSSTQDTPDIPNSTRQSFTNTTNLTQTAMETEESIAVSLVANVAPQSEEMALSDEQENMISEFCAVTASEVEAARNVLEATNWDLQQAMMLYLESDNPSSAFSSSIRRLPSPPPMDALNPLPMPTPMPMPFMPSFHSHFSSFMGDGQYAMEEDSPPRPGHDEFDEEGVRRPDPVKMQRLIYARSASADIDDMTALGRVEDSSVDWLFTPPRHLSSVLSLEKTRESAEKEGRWVLINLQSHEEFSSHLLNRDVWTDDTIESMLRGDFMFWQRGHTSEQGRGFMGLYKIRDEQLPLIAIMHPITGAILFKWTGLIAPEELAAQLIAFHEAHPLPQPCQPSKPPSHAPSAPTPAPAPASQKSEEVRDAAGTREAERVKKIDYGPVSDEPQESEGDTIKISLRLPSQPPFTRRFRKTDSVRTLFALALSRLPEEQGQGGFELFTRFPTQNLSLKLDATLGECNLDNVQVNHKWL